MTLSPGFRKLLLTAHLTFSVGWLGAVLVFLALALAGLRSPDAQLVRAAYQAMELSAFFVIVPASLGALLTGVAQALGTHWGLFRHYWVLVKLVLTVAATALLLLHLRPIGFLAGVVSSGGMLPALHRGLRLQMVLDAGAAALLLLGLVLISVYRPWGRTPFGRPRQPAPPSHSPAGPAADARWGTGGYVLAALLLLLGLVILKHLLGGGLRHH
ncbi:hypothetical protein GCM10023185_00520 [Hymenobacter saemangeumensis]|uniref:DUF2269 domain-containing protein n=1 Tax=Hymenobacter saemangeumensis TaxID=1084522 RepID=A0ABP8HWW2_9BACT